MMQNVLYTSHSCTDLKVLVLLDSFAMLKYEYCAKDTNVTD